jgi:hypothetical protein
MDMTWENLTRLFTRAAQHGSEAKEDRDRFMASHSEPPA